MISLIGPSVQNLGLPKAFTSVIPIAWHSDMRMRL